LRASFFRHVDRVLALRHPAGACRERLCAQPFDTGALRVAAKFGLDVAAANGVTGRDQLAIGHVPKSID
jgi:hypothetical protein